MRIKAGWVAVALMALPVSGAVAPEDRAALEQVRLDAAVVRRVAEVARRDLPKDILLRIIDEDIHLLRGRIDESSYRYAHFEPIEAGRVSEGYSVRAEEEGRFDRSEFRARNVFALEISIPSRRMLVTRNADVWIERVTLSWTGTDGLEKNESFQVGRRIEAGASHRIDFPEVALDALVIVFARGEGKTANMELQLIKADLVDNADSPYFGSVQNAKLLREAVDRRDLTAVQSLASTLEERLGSLIGDQMPVFAEIEVPSGNNDDLDFIELYLQLEMIEDLLQGSPGERDEALERLRELARGVRELALERRKRDR